MKTAIKVVAIGTLLLPITGWAVGVNDNEVMLDQAGDTLKLYIDQIGYGNKLGGSI